MVDAAKDPFETMNASMGSFRTQPASARGVAGSSASVITWAASMTAAQYQLGERTPLSGFQFPGNNV